MPQHKSHAAHQPAEQTVCDCFKVMLDRMENWTFSNSLLTKYNTDNKQTQWHHVHELGAGLKTLRAASRNNLFVYKISFGN